MLSPLMFGRVASAAAQGRATATANEMLSDMPRVFLRKILLI
jgi:hypothetical protein